MTFFKLSWTFFKIKWNRCSGAAKRIFFFMLLKNRDQKNLICAMSFSLQKFSNQLWKCVKYFAGCTLQLQRRRFILRVCCNDFCTTDSIPDEMRCHKSKYLKKGKMYSKFEGSCIRYVIFRSKVHLLAAIANLERFQHFN